MSSVKYYYVIIADKVDIVSIWNGYLIWDVVLYKKKIGILYLIISNEKVW